MITIIKIIIYPLNQAKKKKQSKNERRAIKRKARQT